MIPKIKDIKAISDFKLKILFDDNKTVIYDVAEDISAIESFKPLKEITGLFNNFIIDQSRTCVSWTDEIDLPSDILYEYGKSA